MSKMINDYNGEFIHIDCNIFPITSFMYRDRTILKTESVYNLKEYVINLIDKLDVGNMNLDLMQKNIDDVLELILNEKGIVCISLKGKYYEK